MTNIIVSPTGKNTGTTGTELEPLSLATGLKVAKQGDNILLRGGDYSGRFSFYSPDCRISNFAGEPARLVGTDDTYNSAWLRIASSAENTYIKGLRFEREGAIENLFSKGYKDFGLMIEAPGVQVKNLRMFGMAKGIQVKGSLSKDVVITSNHIGPTIQSGIVVTTSYGEIRRLMIAFNAIERSYQEDGIQFMNDTVVGTVDKVTNLGAIIYRNEICYNNENGIDLKGAGNVIIDSNLIYRSMGSNDGLAYGGNRNSPGAIMRGARTNCRDVIIRNNVIYNNFSGIRMYDGFMVYNNVILWNMFDYTGPGSTYRQKTVPTFWGVSETSKTSWSAVKNNQIGLHEKDLYLMGGPDVDGNYIVGSVPNVDLNTYHPYDFFAPSYEGSIPGAPLTYAVGSGKGSILPVVNARYFTTWFDKNMYGEELIMTPDAIYVGEDRVDVVGVDTLNNTLFLSKEIAWKDLAPISWRTPYPEAGIQRSYAPPKPQEPTETVRMVLEVDMTTSEAAQLRKFLENRQYKVTIA